ncbi:MAG: hypothetical protein LBJ87_12385, partial [bacterium]|nr:hypothetical protein [bacterium]
MVGKLAFFAIGYVLGTRAGRERFEQIAGLARWTASREEVRSGFGLLQSAAQVGIERALNGGGRS